MFGILTISKQRFGARAIVALVSSLCFIICVSTSSATEQKTAGTQAKNLLPNAQKCLIPQTTEHLDRINAILAPHKLGDNLDKTWQFACIEQIDEKNMVFSLKNNETGKKLYIWLTSSGNTFKSDRKTNDFNVTYAQEDSATVDPQYRSVGESVSDIIDKNNAKKLDWQLKEYDKNQSSFKVSVPVEINKGKGTSSSKAAQPLWRILFLLVVPAIFIGNILYRAAISRSRSRQTRVKKS